MNFFFIIGSNPWAKIDMKTAILRRMRIVRTRRVGKVVFFALDDEHIRAVINTGLRHIAEPVQTIEVLS